jgi:hypothetical protein
MKAKFDNFLPVQHFQCFRKDNRKAEWLLLVARCLRSNNLYRHLEWTPKSDSINQWKLKKNMITSKKYLVLYRPF